VQNNIKRAKGGSLESKTNGKVRHKVLRLEVVIKRGCEKKKNGREDTLAPSAAQLGFNEQKREGEPQKRLKNQGETKLVSGHQSGANNRNVCPTRNATKNRSAEGKPRYATLRKSKGCKHENPQRRLRQIGSNSKPENYPPWGQTKQKLSILGVRDKTDLGGHGRVQFGPTKRRFKKWRKQ